VRVGLIGRTHWLRDAGLLALERGHEIAFLATAPASSDARVGVEELRQFAEARQIPFSDDVRVGRLSLEADICLSVNWTTVLRQSFLDRFPHGVLNAHAGDLPRYRGNATLNWAILNQEEEACLTVHRMVEALDAGPIALQRRRPIAPDDDMTSLSSWLDEVIPAALVEALDGIADGTLQFTEQSTAIRPLRVYPRKPEDSRIDWRASAESIVRLVRASSPPFSGALTQTELGQQIVIFRAAVHHPDHDFLAVPGQVCYSVGGNPVIATGDGMVEIVECAQGEDAKKAILSSLRNRLV
jgi:methionyl-tRNA formyltransferase